MNRFKPRPCEPQLAADRASTGLHPAWIALIRHCMQMGYGEIERIKIQDGVPVLIEKSIERIKLT